MNKHAHLIRPLNSLQKIHNNLDRCLSKPTLLDSLIKDLQKLIDDPIIIQAIEFIEKCNIATETAMKSAAEIVIAEYEYIEQIIHEEYNVNENTSLAVIEDLHKVRNCKAIKGVSLVLLKKEHLHDNLRLYWAEKPQSGMEYLQIEEKINSLIERPRYIEWKRKKQEYEDSCIILHIARNLKYFESLPVNSTKTNDLIVKLRLFCSCFLDRLSSAKVLATVSINQITYNFIPTKKTIHVFINEAKKTFKGKRAQLLYTALQSTYMDPDAEPDIEEYCKILNIQNENLKKLYDLVYRHFEDINRQFQSDPRLIKFGIDSFVIVESYTIKINESYASLIIHPKK